MKELTANIAVLINIITAPKVAFHVLKKQPRILFPLMLFMIAAVLVFVSYYASVDYTWMVDQVVSAQGDTLSEAEQANMRAAMTSMPPIVMIISATIGAAISIPMMLAMMTVYLVLINKLLDTQKLSFPAWLSLLCWTSIPSLFTSLASLLNIFVAHSTQLSIENINPLTFNQLLFHLEPKDPLFAPLNSFDPMHIWSTILLIWGYSYWTGRNLSQSAMVVLLPTALIYAAWIAIALR